VPVVVKVCEIKEPVPSDPPVTPFSSTLQVNVVPDISELRLMEAVLPLQIAKLEGVAIGFGVGLTVTVAVIKEPIQPLEDIGVII
jgi:hypothetical protein